MAHENQDPEDMLREILNKDAERASRIPRAKHKKYSKKAMRMRKSVPPPANDWSGEEPTSSEMQPPREKIDSIPPIDLRAEREKRASRIPPPPALPKFDLGGK